MTDEQIIDVRKAVHPNDTTPWADTLAFARALITAYEAHKKDAMSSRAITAADINRGVIPPWVKVNWVLVDEDKQ